MKKDFDKYWHYLQAVQSPDLDVRFIRKCYRELRNKLPRTFREDFCSTFSLSCEWVKLDRECKAICVDIDSQPLLYGEKNYLSRLRPDQRKRVRVIQSNVLKKNLPKADIIAVLNFSYCILKERKELKRYFSQCLRSLHSKGIFVLDCFGGSDCFAPNEEQVGHKNFTYFWEQENFDPISHDASFHIHFKRRGERKRKKVFSYNWRLWTVPEIRDLLREVGFRKIHIYWEGTNRNGEGDGKFVRANKGEDCEAWVAYIVSEK